jgi:hypothetical protein
MNKNLKIGLILGGTALVLGTVIYFATRKTEEPVAEGEEKGSEESKADTSEEKKTSESSSKPKASRPKQTASKGVTTPAPTKTAPTPTPKPTAPLPPKVTTKTLNLKGHNVASILRVAEKPEILKGRVVSTTKDGTILMGAKGVTLYTLKKGTTVGRILNSNITSGGNYLVDVKMNNGKTVTVNGSNLIIAV